jgi:hypothetical protein
LRKPDFLRVLLHPAGLGENLADFLLGHRFDLAFLVKNNGAHAGGSGIEGKNVLTWELGELRLVVGLVQGVKQ